MSIPIVPLLKLIALGSIKIIFLGLGALIVPVLTVRLVVGGTGESIRLATQWMVDHGKMEQAEADTFLASLTKVQQADYTRAQARGLLFVKIKKTCMGTLTAMKSFSSWVISLFKRT